MLLDLNQSTYRNLSLFPNGKTAEVAGNISLYLHVTNAEGTAFKVNHKIGLMDRKTQNIQFFYVDPKRYSQEFKSGFSLQNIMSNAALFDASKNFVVDGKITIACEVS